nr:hypothetical protein [Tanacetum cinerariifolium]
MLADAKLLVTFWAEAVNTACYVQNRVLVNKSQNKTPYELFNGRTPAIGFLKPFGCYVMILNTLDNLGKFKEKGDEGTKDAANQEVKKNVSSLRYIALPNWAHDALLESSSSKPQDDCSTDVPETNGNSNPTATSTNPPADHLKTLTLETPIPTASSPVPTGCFTDSPEPSSDARLISKRVVNQVETPSLNNILTLANRFEDILEITTNSDESNGVEADVNNMETITPRVLGSLTSSINSQFKPKKISDALQDPSWVEAMQEEHLQFKIQNVWTLVDCPKGPPRFQDLEFPANVYKVEKAMYGLHQAPRAWHQVTPKECHLHAVKRIFRYLKGHPKLGLWYLKESPFDLVAYSDSDYGGATQDYKSTTGGCQFLEYVAAASCCGEVMWIQKQLLDYGLSMPCEALSKEISSSILHFLRLIPLVSKGDATMTASCKTCWSSSPLRHCERFHTAKTIDLVWIWLGGDYGNVFLMGFHRIQWLICGNGYSRNGQKPGKK